MAKTKEPFAQIPLSVLCNSKLSASARVLYGLIISKHSSEGYCYATNSTLAEWLGTTESTVVKRLKELKNEGLIKFFYATNEQGTSRKIYPQVLPKGDIENHQKGVSKTTRDNTLSKERVKKVLWQRPSHFPTQEPNV